MRSSKAESCWTEPLGFIEELWGTATWQYSRDNACRAYHRGGALAYLAAYDVHRAKIYGRCDATTGIEPFTALVAQVMTQEPYASADRVFWVVDNGSSRRGQKAIDRLAEQFPNAQTLKPRVRSMLTPILPIEESIAVAGEVVAFGDSGAWAQRTRRVGEDCSSTREMPSGILPQTGELAELIGVRLAVSRGPRSVRLRATA